MINKRPASLVRAVATTIKEIRHSKKISQEALAASANLDRTYISGIERATRNITLESLESVIDGLEISIGDFLDILKNKIDLEDAKINEKDIPFLPNIKK
jgi:transcriptional regulator with XRE-family HTH domain